MTSFRSATHGFAVLTAALLHAASSAFAQAPPEPPAPAAPAASAPAQAGSRPVLTKAPKLVRFVEAPFPESERAAGAGASVVLEILISAQGKVDAARVISPASPAFDSAALEAVKQFEFEPAEIDGKPAPIKIQYRYEFVLQQAPPPQTVLRGEVRRSTDGQPMAGVSVTLDSGETAVTDREGRFELVGLSPGAHTVMLSGPDLAALQTEERLEEGQELGVRYDVEPIASVAADAEAPPSDDMEIVVVAPKLTRQVVATRVEAESARRVAGTQGDVLKIVENMPGVARAAVGSGDVVVWGAAPEDTRVYVDGVRVPALYHYGGLRSVVHSDLVQAVELVPGAYGAPFGRGLGGLVTVDTRDPDDERLHQSVQLDLLDASAAVQGPLGGRVRVAGALRRSHLHDVLSGGISDDVEEFFPIPRYHDASARLRFEPSNAEWVELGGLLSNDSVTRRIGQDDPQTRRSETREIGFDRLFVRYRSEPGDGSRVTLVPWFGRDRSRLRGAFGATPVRQEVDAQLYGLRAAWSGQLVSGITLNAGLDIEVQRAEARREGSVSAPPREGDARVFGQPPADQVNVDAWTSTAGSAAPYAELDIALLEDRWHLVPGLRLEPFFTGVNRRRPAESSAADVGAFSAELSVQPRLSTRLALSRQLTLKAAYGRYRQPSRAEDLSSVFGNPLLGTSHATHYLLGGELGLGALGAEATLFYSSSGHLPVRNPLPSPRVAETLLGLGAGRSYGAQLLVRRNLGDGWFGWLAYTLQKSERRDVPAFDYRPFDFDQTHVLTALLSYDLGAGFDVGARVRVASGYPRTPVVGTYFDARRDQFEPLLGAKNSIRIPTFWQGDIRASKRWEFAGSRLEAYLDVQNVTNHQNAEEIVYAADYSERRYIRGLPILPVLGLSWAF